MTENNVKDPQHYKIGNLETIDLIQQVVDDFGSVCQANILKYGIRANRKYENPKDDIQKTIRYGEFWLNDLDGNPASSPRVEEIATIDKLKDMLNSQEKELIKDKKIKCIVINNKEIPEHITKDIIKELLRSANEKQKI